MNSTIKLLVDDGREPSSSWRPAGAPRPSSASAASAGLGAMVLAIGGFNPNAYTDVNYLNQRSLNNAQSAATAGGGGPHVGIAGPPVSRAATTASWTSTTWGPARR